MTKTRKPNTIAFIYCFAVFIAFKLAFYGFFTVPMQWKLSNQMGLGPSQVSLFLVLSDIPAWIAFMFGFLRDRWRPRKMGDRAYFLIGGSLMAIVYVGLGFCPPSYVLLFAWSSAQTILQAFLGAAASGLVASVAQWHGMMGRLGAMTIVTDSLARMLSSSAGGVIDEEFGHAWPYLASALFCFPIVLVAFWRPRAVFDVEQDLEAKAIPENVGASLKRLARHKAIYLPAVINFLWVFAPGWGTPLLFFLTKDRHLSEAIFGKAQGIVPLGFLVSSLAYSWLCLRFRFRALLFAGTVGGILGAGLFFFVTDAPTAYLFSFLAGLSCGIPLASYTDLIIRSCPKEYEGAAFMLFASAGYFAGDVSDLFGSWLYERGGFGLSQLATAATTGLILVVLPFVSRRIIDPTEGTPILVDLDSVVLA
jgi:MFS family permease